MKKFLCMVLTIFVLFTCPVISSASQQAPIEVSVDYTNSTVTVYGAVSPALAGQYVTLQILNPGKTVNDIFSDGALNLSEQSVVANDGKYTFSATVIPAENMNDNLHMAVITITGYNETLTMPFPLYSIEYVANIFSTIADSNETLREAMEDNLPLFGFEDSKDEYYNSFCELSEPDQELVLSGMRSQSLKNQDEVTEALKVSCKLLSLTGETDAAKYTTEMFVLCPSIKASAISAYESYTTEKQTIVDTLSANKYTDPSLLANSFEGEIIKKEFSSSEITLWNEMYNSLTNFNDILELDFTVYNGLKGKSSVMTNMLAVSYTTAEQIKQKFNEEVAAQVKAEAGNSDEEYVNSSGNGGKNTSVTVKTPIDLEDVTTDSKANAFKDLNGYAWALESVETLAQKGVVSGYPDGTFRPENNVSRAEFIKMFVLAMNYPLDNSGCTFDDVKENDWFYDYVGVAQKYNLINGTGTGFNPYGEITREDIAVIIQRCLTIEKNDFNELHDVELCADYSYDSVITLTSAGIINGFEDGTFRPKNSATRAQTAVLLLNAVNYSEKDR